MLSGYTVYDAGIYTNGSVKYLTFPESQAQNVLFDLRVSALRYEQANNLKHQVDILYQQNSEYMALVENLKKQADAVSKKRDIDAKDWLVRTVSISALACVVGAAVGAVVVSIVKK